MSTTGEGPFHEGELRMQELAGEAGQALANGAMIRRVIPAGARSFFARQAMLVLATEDASGQPWASVVLGRAPFADAEAEAGTRLRLDTSRIAVVADDPAWTNLGATSRIAVLAIELATRRRFRVQGRVASAGDGSLEVAVEEAFPNCPKYIQRRDGVPEPGGPGAASATERGHELDPARVELLSRADTLFLATAHAARGLDASHRGGPAGFARVAGPRRIRIPDYPGNSMFQSFGNVLTEPRIGIAAPDFARSRVLQIAGTARVALEPDGPREPSGGTGRWLEVEVERWVEHAAGMTWELSAPEASPFLPRA